MKKKSHIKKHSGKSNTLAGIAFPDVFLMLAGAFISGFALKGFLIPNQFLDGGATGISLLIHSVSSFKFPVVFVVVNLPLIMLGLYEVNKMFVIKTLISVICVSLFVAYIPYPLVTSDKLLTAVFGGFFSGVGIGLTIRAGSVLDSMDILALYTFKRSNFSVSEIILLINAIIFIIAAFHFGIETALYSMLTYFTALKASNYIAEGIEEYTGVTIISANTERIKYRLVNNLGRGVTIYKGERGFLPGSYKISVETEIIFTVITRLELRKLKNVVQAEDPKAVVFVNVIKEAAGGVLKRRPSHS